MDRLFLGFIGGLVATIATIAGAFLIFFKSSLGNKFNKNLILKLRLDFFVGILLTLTALSLIYPTKIDKDISLATSAFLLGILFFVLSKKLLLRMLESIAIDNLEQRGAILFILIFTLKNIPLGLAAGSAMSMAHTGEGNSLLTVLAIHNIFGGAAVAICFLRLGLDSTTSILAATCCGIFALVSGLSGGYLCTDGLNILPLIMAFSGGALVSPSLQEVFSVAQREFKKVHRKILLSPGFLSVFVVMLIFIFWKELL